MASGRPSCWGGGVADCEGQVAAGQLRGGVEARGVRGAVFKSVTGGGEGIMDAVAKAGITTDAVMKGVGGLDVDRLL